MKQIKLIILKLIFFLIFFNQSSFSKGLPPGTGVGDLPVNILILLDTSQSMEHKPLKGEGIDPPNSLAIIDNAVLVGESPGVEKYIVETKVKDKDFHGGEKVYVGSVEETCQIGGETNTKFGQMHSMAVSTKVKGMIGQELIYLATDAYEKVVVIDSDGNCVKVIDALEMGKDANGHVTDRLRPKKLALRTINDEDHLLVTGSDEWCTKTHNKKKHKCITTSKLPFIYSKNLTTGVGKRCSNEDTMQNMGWHDSATISDTHLYWLKSEQIHRVPISKEGGVYCPSASSRDHTFTTSNSPIDRLQKIMMDPQANNVMYAISKRSHTIQKLVINNKTLREVVSVGGSEECTASSNTGVKLCKPQALYVGNDSLWIGGNKNSIQEFDISDASKITWVKEMGSSKFNLLKGAAEAIKSVVTDSSLTQGANFGFGTWNAGRQICKSNNKASNLWKAGCEYSCGKELGWKGKKDHQRAKTCNYYDSWKKPENLGAAERTIHPFGRSQLCNDNSCLRVGIDERTSENIIYHLDNMKIRYGTDARAFSQLAYKYFTDTNVNIVDTNLTCQLNYVIVISDGKWVRHDYGKKTIKALRDDTQNKVKTLVVAYGEGTYNAENPGDTETQYDEMAEAGSCDPNSAEDSANCEPVIIAKTPGALKQKLKSSIQRILTSRLSFTAPSITASVQEGGELYQAQFEWREDAEWKGSLIRKQINEDQSIDHLKTDPGNWDAADHILEQAVSDLANENSRKIWTVHELLDYKSDYNNFKTDNWDKINDLFEILGEQVVDFHNENSNCGGDNGIEDDIKGLIGFVRGKDYFAYQGCSNINNVRRSVLGDIYHSQPVEVGPPNANTYFTNNNQESFFRSTQNYASFATQNSGRDRILYVGANDGMLHAIRATASGNPDDQAGDAGDELWAFVPPFIAGKLPTMVNEGLDGIGSNNKKGGSVAIFAVDGSPVVHDVYIKGIDENGNYENQKNWHTILFIPYGRGGPGFSVLDITNPHKPHHMFSVYNDQMNQVVLIADKDGKIYRKIYDSGSMKISESEEARLARYKYDTAFATIVGDNTTPIDNIATCETISNFYLNGNNSCYSGKTWTFDFVAPAEVYSDPQKLTIYATNSTLETIPVKAASVTRVGDYTRVTLDTEFTYAYGESDNLDVPVEANENFAIRWSTQGTEDEEYDYSTLGETWSSPRIIRIPVPESGNLYDDKYVAVLAGGFGTDGKVGSSIFLVDLNDPKVNFGKIYGAIENQGPIRIADTEQSPVNIANAITGDPVVVTPDTFKGANWRGAMVYVADLEGKITKINLTNDEGANLYDQTTLFKLNTTLDNGRYMYFGMDAAYGNDTKNLWLFGGTGDFTKISSKRKGTDNILFGIRDRDFPKFVNLNGAQVGTAKDGIDKLLERAKAGANAAKHVDDINHCENTRGANPNDCPGEKKEAWIYKLDEPNDKTTDTQPGTAGRLNKDRKASAMPTVFRGTVYYPIYQPPEEALCNVGNAYVCSADDECGINNSDEIDNSAAVVRDESGYDVDTGCYYIQPGILSRLVVFGHTLYGNITTDIDAVQMDTLVTLLANEGEISSYRGSWRENY